MPVIINENKNLFWKTYICSFIYIIIVLNTVSRKYLYYLHKIYVLFVTMSKFYFMKVRNFLKYLGNSMIFQLIFNLF